MLREITCLFCPSRVQYPVAFLSGTLGSRTNGNDYVATLAESVEGRATQSNAKFPHWYVKLVLKIDVN